MRDVSEALKVAALRKILVGILLGGEQLVGRFSYYNSPAGLLGFDKSLVTNAVMSYLNLKAERPTAVFLDCLEAKGLLAWPPDWLKRIFEGDYV